MPDLETSENIMNEHRTEVPVPIEKFKKKYIFYVGRQKTDMESFQTFTKRKDYSGNSNILIL